MCSEEILNFFLKGQIGKTCCSALVCEKKNLLYQSISANLPWLCMRKRAYEQTLEFGLGPLGYLQVMGSFLVFFY